MRLDAVGAELLLDEDAAPDDEALEALAIIVSGCSEASAEQVGIIY